MSERWRSVPGYEGLYEISDLGSTRSARRNTNTFVGRALKPWKTKNGRLQVMLYLLGEPKHHLVHRLVAAAFIGPCPEGKQVNHIDGVATNNRLENLEYVTPSENSLHSFALGMSSQTGEENSCHKLTEDNVREILSLIGTEAQWKIGKRFGVNQSVISRIYTGNAWTCVDKTEGTED